MLAKVYVTPKRGVLDPQGKAVAHALHALGFGDVADVRIGKYIEIHLEDDGKSDAENRVRQMCEKLLANQVIEDFHFEIAAEGAGRR